MIRNRKVLGLTFLTMLAALAITASPASAESQFTSEIEFAQTTLTGFQETGSPNQFTLGNKAPLSCKFVTYHGSFTPAEGTVVPTFTQCTMYGKEASITGFNAATCDWHIFAKRSVDLRCAAGKDVEVDTEVCTITITPQTGLQKFSVKAVAGKKDVTLTWEVSGLAYEYIGGFACEIVSGVNVGVLYKDGEYEGAMTLKGDDKKNGAEVTIGWDA